METQPRTAKGAYWISILHKYDYNSGAFFYTSAHPIFQFYISTITMGEAFNIPVFFQISILHKYDYN